MYHSKVFRPYIRNATSRGCNEGVFDFCPLILSYMLNDTEGSLVSPRIRNNLLCGLCSSHVSAATLYSTFVYLPKYDCSSIL